MFFACNQKRTDNTVSPDSAETTPIDTEKTSEVKKEGVITADTNVTIPTANLTYQLIRNSDSLSIAIQKNFHGDSLEVLMALNRVDEHHFHRPDSLIFPDQFTTLLSYSPFPDTIHEIDTAAKMILISYRIQAIALYEFGKLIRWAPASLGKKTTPTPTGLFYTNWKAKTTTSTENPEWILNWYFNLDNFRGVSLHEYELPGLPASHACIRLQDSVAKFIYYWADQWKVNPEGKITKPGTPVLIFGKYAFGKRRPWRTIVNGTDDWKIRKEELLNAI